MLVHLSTCRYKVMMLDSSANCKHMLIAPHTGFVCLLLTLVIENFRVMKLAGDDKLLTF